MGRGEFGSGNRCISETVVSAVVKRQCLTDHPVNPVIVLRAGYADQVDPSELLLQKFLSCSETAGNHNRFACIKSLFYCFG